LGAGAGAIKKKTRCVKRKDQKKGGLSYETLGLVRQGLKRGAEGGEGKLYGASTGGGVPEEAWEHKGKGQLSAGTCGAPITPRGTTGGVQTLGKENDQADDLKRTPGGNWSQTFLITKRLLGEGAPKVSTKKLRPPGYDWAHGRGHRKKKQRGPSRGLDPATHKRKPKNFMQRGA